MSDAIEIVIQVIEKLANAPPSGGSDPTALSNALQALSDKQANDEAADAALAARVSALEARNATDDQEANAALAPPLPPPPGPPPSSSTLDSSGDPTASPTEAPADSGDGDPPPPPTGSDGAGGQG